MQYATFFIFSDADRIPDDRCVTLQHSSENIPCTLFHICPNHLFSGNHVCNKSNEPFDDWFNQTAIFKASCGKNSQNSLLSFNETDLMSCDAAWQDRFQVGETLCNLSGTVTNYNQTNSALVKPSAVLALIWALGLLAIIGNMIVLITSSRVLKQGYRFLSKVQKIHHIMLINLALADFLMGVYLVDRGGLMYITSVGDGTRKDVPQHLCNILGVITVVSSQMSVTVLVLITSFRLYSTLKPLKELNLNVAYVLIALGWILWIFIGSVPLLNVERMQQVFVFFKDTGCEGKPHRFTYTLMRDYIQQFMKSFNSACSFALNRPLRLRDGLKTQHLLKMLQHLKIVSKSPSIYDYYQEKSLCAPVLYLSSVDSHRFFGFSLLAFNFCGFLFLFVAYILICFKSTKRKSFLFCCCCCCSGLRNAADYSARDIEDRRLQCRVFFIIVTDLLCWIPTAIMGFWYTAFANDLTMRETCQFMMSVIPSLGTATGILIPINSVVNPLVYTSTMNSVINVVYKLCGLKQINTEDQNHSDQTPNT